MTVRRRSSRGALALAVALTACAGGETNRTNEISTAGATTVASTTSVGAVASPPAGPALPADLDDVRAQLRAGIDELMSADVVEVTGSQDAGDPTTVRITVEPRRRAFDSWEEIAEGVVYRRVLVDGVLSTRVETAGDGPAWSVNPVDPQYAEAAFTYHGRAFDTLAVLVSVVDAVDFRATRRLDAASADAASSDAETVYELTAPAAVVLRSLIDLGVERADIVDLDHVEGDTTIAVVLGERVLRGLTVSGVVLHDSEAIEGSVSLRYSTPDGRPSPVTLPS